MGAAELTLKYEFSAHPSLLTFESFLLFSILLPR